MSASSLVTALAANKLTITTAESCTGGLVAAAITDISGASDVFHQGFITYADEAKMHLLGVKESTLLAHGAVSEETAREMAEGARKNASANIAIATTGIAGPTGGSPEKPVGLVYITVASATGMHVKRCHFSGNREDIRIQTVETALQLALIAVGG